MKTNEIRKKFLEFFEQKQHKIVPSSTIIPQDDPTLLFTSAGMVQFKEFFQAKDTAHLPYTRSASCQKCLRAGGKKSDLENVGRTPRHHSFFEMLGNFSFGDYFKQEAIDWAWEFSVGILKIDASSIWATVYLDDDEAFEMWTKYLPKERIVRLGKKDNFWGPAGETGPCGPCSELHVDLGPEMGCGSPDCKPGCDCDRFLEFWNLVFTQFDMQADGSLVPLSKKNIDTGMGLERLASILQGVTNNFYTDIFTPIIQATEKILNVKYTKNNETHFHIIADHIRTVTFAFSDGVTPSNEGRGYVIRRILRRALRQAKILGYSEPFMYKLAVVVADEMGDTYPEIREALQHTQNLIKMEEERFLETLTTGMALLDTEIHALKKKNSTKLSGDAAFKLYDTYGFPFELTFEICEEQGIQVSEDEFKIAMEEQRKRGRESWEGTSDTKRFGYVVEKGLPPTDFLGYTAEESEAWLVYAHDAGDHMHLVFDQTPFYGESGGQAGDVGVIRGNDFEFIVKDTQKSDNAIIHIGTIVHGTPHVGEIYFLSVDVVRRRAIARNHTATHLLHKALKMVLGAHVNQAGSLVEPDRLRFDFTHTGAVTAEQLLDIERIVNEAVRRNIELTTQVMNVDEAKKSGAMALFGEKYGDSVRVVTTGDFSKELCGGTHVRMTGEIGFMKILSESGISTGVRRIEALTGEAAFDHIIRGEAVLSNLSQRFKTDRSGIEEKIERIFEKEKELSKEIEKLKSKNASSSLDDILAGMQTVNGLRVVVSELQTGDVKIIREMAQQIKDKLATSSVVVLLGSDGEKVNGVVMVTQDAVGTIKAGDIAKVVSQELGGGGGGRPDMAQCGGKEIAKIGSALEKARVLIRG